MSKYAIIRMGGKQFKVKEGLSFELEHQAEANFDVLLYSDDKEVLIGTPVLKDVTLKLKLEDAGLSKKVMTARFKSKSRYRKRKGHRQPISKVTIESIAKTAVKSPKKAAPKTAKPKASAKKVN